MQTAPRAGTHVPRTLSSLQPAPRIAAAAATESIDKTKRIMKPHTGSGKDCRTGGPSKDEWNRPGEAQSEIRSLDGLDQGRPRHKAPVPADLARHVHDSPKSRGCTRACRTPHQMCEDSLQCWVTAGSGSARPMAGWNTCSDTGSVQSTEGSAQHGCDEVGIGSAHYCPASGNQARSTATSTRPRALNRTFTTSTSRHKLLFWTS